MAAETTIAKLYPQFMQLTDRKDVPAVSASLSLEVHGLSLY
jgi:hypothetical protein